VTAPAEQPALRIVRGEPTPEELAALVVVLAGRSAASSSVTGEPRPLWRSRGRNVRPPLAPGPGAWRASALPR